MSVKLCINCVYNTKLISMHAHIKLQEPRGRVIGTRMVQKGGTMKEEKDLCYDVPLLESLQNLMNMEVVRDQVHRLHNF